MFGKPAACTTAGVEYSCAYCFTFAFRFVVVRLRFFAIFLPHVIVKKMLVVALDESGLETQQPCDIRNCTYYS